MVQKMHKLPELTRRLLGLAANIGDRFDLQLVSYLVRSSPKESWDALKIAVNENAVFVIGEDSEWVGEVIDPDKLDVSFKFSHDRVQQAAYSLIDHQDFAALHLKIGQKLLEIYEKLPKLKFEENLLIIVDHLNFAEELITSPEERENLVKLNLQAAIRSKSTIAYSSALNYVKHGKEFLGASACDHYELNFQLSKLEAELEYLLGNFEIAEKLYDVILAGARSDMDKISIYFIMRYQYELQSRFIESIDIMRKGLSLLGVYFPEIDAESELQVMLNEEVAAIPINRNNRKPSELLSAPEVTDQKMLTIMNLLLCMWTPSFLASKQTIATLVSTRMANLCLKYGNSEYTSISYLNYSFFAGDLTGDYILGYELGRVGVALSDAYPNLALRCKTYFIFGTGANNWCNPMRSSSPYLEKAVEYAVQSGDLVYAGHASPEIVSNRFLQGAPLKEVFGLYNKYFEYLKKTHAPIYYYGMCTSQPVRDLLKNSEKVPDEDFLKIFEKFDLFMSAFYFGKMVTAFFLDDQEQLRKVTHKALELVPGQLRGTLFVPETKAIGALVYLNWATELETDEQRTWFDEASRLCEDLKIKANFCEANFKHKVLLIEAEMARVENKTELAIQLYDESIQSAHQYEFIQWEALALELYAKFWTSRKNRRFAQTCLQESEYLYQRWGAIAKVEKMKEQKNMTLGNLGNLSPSVKPDVKTTTIHEEQDIGATLDLESVSKVTIASTTEMDMNQLTTSMMSTIIENAGAQRGTLFQLENGQIKVQVECVPKQPEISVNSPNTLIDDWTGPKSLVQYVVRTQVAVVIDDAINGSQFSTDPYVLEFSCKSLLCIPFIIKREMKGILYLENNLVPNLFREKRLKTLNVLANQMLISMENAKFYEIQLKNAKEEEMRTVNALKDEEKYQRQRAEVAEKLKRKMENFVDMICHEIRNPLAGVFGNTDFIQTSAQRINTALSSGNLNMDDVKSTIVNEVGSILESCEAISKCSKHQRVVTDDVLNLSKLRGKIFELNMEPYSPQKVIKDVATMLEGQAKKKNIFLNLNLAGEDFIEGDAMRFSQVITNLVSNAIKFTSHGGVSIAMTTEDMNSELLIRISVQDSGIGLSPTDQAKLFKRFSQANSRTAQDYGGSGLGLYLCKKIIKLMNGSISITSQKGHGTTFYVSFCARKSIPPVFSPPTQQIITSPLSPHTIDPSVPLPSGKIVNVLVVEDNLLNQKMLARMLRAKNYTVTCADNGLQGYEQWLKDRPDLIFMDIQMPVMTGLESTLKIRKKEKDENWEPVVIVGLSGNAREEQVSTALDTGMNSYQVKPYTKEHIYAAIASYDTSP
eukprot:TRINITY_DN7330_c0_g1_i2.p1 TRINITY_DN7330_c0_g1~~TRINITY_DN7330_c0_g1_i2.p1  ORF type:complete len:1556 (-),score=526.13 TRINITY_DN7330_c0_g1_i2:16-3996(-)